MLLRHAMPLRHSHWRSRQANAPASLCSWAIHAWARPGHSCYMQQRDLVGEMHGCPPMAHPLPLAQTVCFEGHDVTIVAADAVPVEPIKASALNGCIDINSGQRCVLLVTCIREACWAPAAFSPKRDCPCLALPAGTMSCSRLTSSPATFGEQLCLRMQCSRLCKQWQRSCGLPVVCVTADSTDWYLPNEHWLPLVTLMRLPCRISVQGQFRPGSPSGRLASSAGLLLMAQPMEAYHPLGQVLAKHGACAACPDARPRAATIPSSCRLCCAALQGCR